jgi:hypothetical protein
MTNGTSRLDRIEAILASVTESQQRTQQQQEVNTAAIAELRASNRELNTSIAATNEQLSESISETVEMIGALAADQTETDQRFNNLLEDSRADRQKADQRHAAMIERFDVLLEEGRADRQQMEQNRVASERQHQAFMEQMEQNRSLNESEHRAFRETFQTMLAEIARIWQRLAG